MKLEVSHNGDTRQLEIEMVSADSYTVGILGPDGLWVRQSVRVLSRNEARWTIQIDGRTEDVLIHRKGDVISIDWAYRNFALEVYSLKKRLLQQRRRPEVDGVLTLRAQMPGKVVKILAQVGESVTRGEGLVIVESMKMQNELRSPKTGKIVQCAVDEGVTVEAGTLLFEID